MNNLEDVDFPMNMEIIKRHQDKDKELYATKYVQKDLHGMKLAYYKGENRNYFYFTTRNSFILSLQP